MPNKYILLTLCIVILGRGYFLVEGCHAGHRHGPDEDDDEEEEEGLIPSDPNNGSQPDNRPRSRNRRHVLKNRDTDEIEVRENETQILRKYFRDCMLDKVGVIWDWRSVIDFTILDTIWFLYSSSVACSESKDTDNADCWKTCVEVLLRDNSSLVLPGKECVEEYSTAFNIGQDVYKSKRRKYKYVDSRSKTEYGKCVRVTSTDDSLLFDVTGTVISAEKTDRDIESIVRFVRRDVKCRICDYGFLPGTKRKPPFAENIEIDGNNAKGLWPGERLEYVVTWPFSFEALTRRDSKLRFATTFCNGEFAPTFTKDPPKNLGWADWVSWGKCISDCPNDGIRQRIRVCLDETRKACIGTAVQKEVCSNKNCAHWNSWGSWTPCISTCGVASQFSFRQCIKGSIGEEGCEGEFKREKSCAVRSCPVPWSQWSGCSVTCGKGGVQYRHGGESLLTIRKQKRECSGGRCPDHWTKWEQWGDCSTTCGNGYQRRVRFCVGQSYCSGDSMETRVCVGPSCSSHWGEWARWSDCTWKRRIRYCVGGQNCRGENKEFQKCESIYRPTLTPSRMDKWGEWGKWSSCTRTCGGGERVRYRVCWGIHSYSSWSDPDCPGHSSQSQRCETKPCPPSVRSDSSCKDVPKWTNLCKAKFYRCENPDFGRYCRKTCGNC